MNLLKKEYPALGERIYEGVTSGGLRVRVVPKPGFAKTYAFLAADYGSIDLSFTEAGVRHVTPQGVAHYLEHKMFDMPDGNAMQMFSRYGGSPNAFTSYDMTAYYVQCTQNQLENLQLLLDMVYTPYFTEESVEKEQGIIAQEIRMYEDSAESCVYENLFSAMYAKHPVRNPIAGTVESISEITAQTLYDCHSAFYTPENMMLCVVGDVDPETVFRTADLAVKPGKSMAADRDYGGVEEMRPCCAKVEKVMEVSMPTFALGFKAVPAACGDEVMERELVAQLASEILMGESAPLYSELYTKNLIDSDFSYGYESVKQMGMLAAGGDSNEPEAVLHAILKEARRIEAEGFDTALFERLKRSAIGRWVRALDGFESICYRSCAYHFEGADYLSFPEAFRKVTPEQVAAFLKETVTEERAAISVIRPKLQEVSHV